MVIRPATPADTDAIRHVLVSCGLATDKDLSVISGGIELVAERGGRVVGMVQVLPARPVSYIAYLAVLPEYQKSFAAFRLMEGAELLLKAWGATDWIANIAASDDPLWALTVERYGAVPTSRVATLYHRKLT